MKDSISITRVNNLHPKYRKVFSDFITECENTFNTVYRVAQGFRTFAEQDAIYNQPHDGKDNDGDGKIDETDEKVSNAPAGKSFHNYGIAVDLVEILNGKINWNTDYSKLAPIAKKYGLEWGGNWKSFKDKPHFQVEGMDIKKLYAQYLKKDFIPGTQYINL